MAGVGAATLLLAACGARSELALQDFADAAHADRPEPPTDATLDVTVVDVATGDDHPADGQADVVTEREASTDAPEDATPEGATGEAGVADGAADASGMDVATDAVAANDATGAVDAMDAADAADAIAEIDAGDASDAADADATDAGCTTAEPTDYANWHVSDVPQQLVANTDGTLTDNATGLTWMQGPAGEVDGGTEIYTTSLAAAEAACPCPWRLPQRIELLSIVDYSRYDMALNPLFLAPAADTNVAWTETSYPSTSSWWFVDLIEGAPEGPYGGYMAGQVRCVRGTTQPPAVRYTLQTSDAGISEVVDNGTGLTWKQASEPGALTFQQALGKCAAPYRTPTISELNTLVDSSQTNPAVDTTFFGDTASGYYVSATPVGYLYLPGYYWYVDFSAGWASYDNGGSTPYQVRCVR